MHIKIINPAWHGQSSMNYLEEREKKSGQIKANSPEERIKYWKDHFVNLLGQPPTIDEQSILKIYDTLPIVTGDFTEEKP